MGLYEQLAQNFPTEQTVFGQCLLIPINLFKNEWNEQLKAENVKVFQQSYNGRMFFFLKKSNSNSNSQGVSESQAPSASQDVSPIGDTSPLKPFEWTPENVELVKRLRAEGLGLRRISKRLAELGFKPPCYITISKKLKSLQKPATREAEAEPKPALNCEADDGLFRELMQSAQLLYSHGFRRVCSLVLKEASRLLMEG
ncbi:MAG: hypothetical protein QXN95_03375 [Candidatus Bathyarchaeia archaeon]